MRRGERLTLLLFIFVLLLIIIGNNIHILKLQKRIDSLNIDADAHKRGKKHETMIYIEVNNKVLNLLDSETKEIIKKYTIATGKSASPTPLGTYEIVSKEKWGEGFGSRWMGLNVPWGEYGIHGTNKPSSIGSNISSGCIRMRNSDIEDLFEHIAVGSTVHISNGPYGPFGYGFRTLKPGDRGADVLEVQKRLKYFNFYTGDLDGIYGEEMKKSLLNFLKENNIKLTDKITTEIYEAMGIILME
ncbi:L,D-transpeptidase family protein [Paratissierella segnis]|jgi:hypothetical protein|uniref:L,D-transpeptidase family protein n=1 Tax=Paratissierella segnis TaxID=2763679 RepID=A0A926EXP4_9FIRM|nr:L,D-transpeptidase family protein [Paratissierella segnis]MBC8588204.1 L,D-transpeptidase family protein [Paratissierella segnis]